MTILDADERIEMFVEVHVVRRDLDKIVQRGARNLEVLPQVREQLLELCLVVDVGRRRLDQVLHRFTLADRIAKIEVVDESYRWNHNIHYHPRLLAAVPASARDALDVGCGEGMLARRLALRVPHVVGIDPDDASIETARAASPSLEYVHGDVLTHPFAPASFDMIVSVATLHHLDAGAGLTRLVELLRPGGVLAIVGCARASRPVDALFGLGGAVAHQVLSRRRTFWEHPSPTVWPPPITYREMRELTAELLPGATFRQHLLWRYSIVWAKPNSAAALPEET